MSGPYDRSDQVGDSHRGVESFLSASKAARSLKWRFSLRRWKSEAVGLCCDCSWLHLDSLHYRVNIPALVRTLAFCASTNENQMRKLCFLLSVVHRQSPLRLLLPRRRNPWPWPTTVTWTCKQTRIPQRHDEDTNCLQILVWWPFCHFYSKERKKKPHVVSEKVDGSRESFLLHWKQSSTCLVICLVLVSWGRCWQRPVAFQDETTAHLTFDSVSSVLDLCERKCHKAFG